MNLPFTPALQGQLRAWLNEDIGRGDLTAAALAGRHPASIQTGASMEEAGAGSHGPAPNLKLQLSLSKRMLRSSQGLRVIGALVEIRSMPLDA